MAKRRNRRRKLEAGSYDSLPADEGGADMRLADDTYSLSRPVVVQEASFSIELVKDCRDETLAFLYPDAPDSPKITVQRTGDNMRAYLVGDYLSYPVDPRNQYPEAFNRLKELTRFPSRLEDARLVA
jgi:hypothetical protein